MADLPSDLSAPIDKIATDERAVDQADSGWSVESHSAETEPPPEDTTLESLADEAHGEESATPATARPAQRAAAPATPAKGKKKQTFQERIDELYGQTKQKDRDLEGATGRITALEAEIRALKTAPVKPAEPDATTIAAAAAETARKAAEDAMPDPPRYVDYDSDEDYNKAVATWKTSVGAWTTKREARLREEINTGVDRKLSEREQAENARQRDAAIIGKIETMRQAHPDFLEKVEANAEVFKQIKHPFLHDLIINTPDGGEFLYDLADDPDVALALGSLPLPTRPLADAVRSTPAARQIMKYFATDEGRDAFMHLRTLHPIAVLREVGKLEARLESADRGSDTGARRPISNAVPPARPPVGSPRARAPQGSSGPPPPFEDWMAEEDAKEVAERRRQAGVALPA